MSSLNTLTLSSAIDKLSRKEITLNELVNDVQTAIVASQPEINAYVTVNEASVKNDVSYQDSILKGAPIAIKDNFCTRDLRTTASSNVLEDFRPQFESTVTARLLAAGATFCGKTNLDAWAHGSSTETSDFGRTLNPRNTGFLPGGSSGGSAAAVAADLCLASIGSETAGSIRLPASWTGTVGLKPTYGRVSRFGAVAMASSTDSPGPITKTVEDAAIILNLIAGHDERDGTSSRQSTMDYTSVLNKGVKGLKIGILYHDLAGLEAAQALLEKEVKVLADLGAEVSFAKAMDPHHAISVYTVVQRAEVSSNLARYTGIRYGHDRSYFGSEAKRRIMLGTYTLSKGYADQYYTLAQKVRTLFLKDFERLFSEFDLLISLSTPSYAKPVGASEGAAMFGELEDMLAEPSSIVGLPGISVPCYRDPATNLFLGMNIMAPMWREDLVLQAASAYEQATSWNTWRSS